MNETISSTPKTGVSETVSPQSALTTREVLNDTQDERLTPSFFVYDRGKISHTEIPSDESIFKIGRSENADIKLDDNLISDFQVAVVKIGNYCYFMDCGTKDQVYFNGVKKRQVVAPCDSRMIMKIGNINLVGYRY